MNPADVHERLGSIDARLKAIERALLGNGQAGHEQRLSSLERWRAYITGALAVLGLAVATIGTVVAAVKR